MDIAGAEVTFEKMNNGNVHGDDCKEFCARGRERKTSGVYCMLCSQEWQTSLKMYLYQHYKQSSIFPVFINFIKEWWTVIRLNNALTFYTLKCGILLP